MFIKACSYLNKGTQANRSIRSVAKIVKYTKTILLLLPLRLKRKGKLTPVALEALLL